MPGIWWVLNKYSLSLFSSSKLSGLSNLWLSSKMISHCSTPSEDNWPGCFQMKCSSWFPNTAITFHVLGCGRAVVTHGDMTEQTSICVLWPYLLRNKELALVPAVSHQLSDHLPLLKSAICLSPLCRKLPWLPSGCPRELPDHTAQA